MSSLSFDLSCLQPWLCCNKAVWWKDRKWPRGCTAARLKIGLKIILGTALARSLVTWMHTKILLNYTHTVRLDRGHKKPAALECFQGKKQNKNICRLSLKKQLSKMSAWREGQTPEPHIPAHSDIRCDRLFPFIAALTSFTAIINQSH